MELQSPGKVWKSTETIQRGMTILLPANNARTGDMENLDITSPETEFCSDFQWVQGAVGRSFGSS